MAGAEGAGRAFAVNEKPPSLAGDLVVFLFARVVRDVKQHRQVGLGEEMRKDAPR
jgi:hypothetical protein